MSLVGRRVGLVGTGASSIQILPRLAAEASEVVSRHIGDEEQADLFELRRKAANERQRRFNNGRLVSRFVFREPRTVVVPL